MQDNAQFPLEKDHYAEEKYQLSKVEESSFETNTASYGLLEINLRYQRPSASISGH